MKAIPERIAWVGMIPLMLVLGLGIVLIAFLLVFRFPVGPIERIEPGSADYSSDLIFVLQPLEEEVISEAIADISETEAVEETKPTVTSSPTLTFTPTLTPTFTSSPTATETDTPIPPTATRVVPTATEKPTKKPTQKPTKVPPTATEPPPPPPPPPTNTPVPPTPTTRPTKTEIPYPGP